MQIRRSTERGHADHGWLRTFHTFSFADYYDPRHMGFRSLRVLNDDRVEPSRGFGMHPHRDMEIITYVLEGALEHKDSMGNGSIIRPGDVQRMSAGTGVLHSEFNPSQDDGVHLLQIWILPDQRGMKPSYEQKNFGSESRVESRESRASDERRGKLRLIASRDGREGSVIVHQDVDVFASILDGQEIGFELKPDRHVWLHVATGEIDVNGEKLREGDAVAISDAGSHTIRGKGEILLFDLA